MDLSLPPSLLLSSAKEFGLPLFVYHADIIRRQIEALRNAFSVPSLDIRYASKALNTTGILHLIQNQGCGVDTVSPGEITMALRAGVRPEMITFTPSGVLASEYEFAIRHGVHIHVDQSAALRWLAEHHPHIPVTLRFNPAIQAGGHPKLQVGSHGSKFGFLSTQLDEVKALTDQLAIDVTGVHMHLGSDISDVRSFDRAYDFLLSTGRLWENSIRHINVGGGFKVPYHPQDHAIDIGTFGHKVSQRFNSFCDSIGRNISLVIEPGKFLVSEAGYLLMQVTYVRKAGEIPMVYVQSGFNHFLRPMSYGAYHHIINVSNPAGPVSSYDIVGYLCETDTFALNRTLNEVREGDILCLMNAGAYGYTMASNYNGRPRPAEVLVDNNVPKLIRRAETIEDLLRTDLGV